MNLQKILLPCIAAPMLLAGHAAVAQKKQPPVSVRKTLGKAAAAPVKVTSVEGITEYRLANGLRVLLFPDPSKPKITVNITYMVGSRLEGYGETGMAHLLEHMMFKGSVKHTNVPQELTNHGADPNGTTSYDRTNYFESFNATDENLNWALDLESDRMINSFIADKDLKSEFSVVRNEFESGENSPSNVLMERVLSTAYLWHNYGKSTIGSKEDIERVPIKNLQAFYKKYYQPDNAILLVAGKIDEPKTLELINKYFGSIPRPARVLDNDYTVEPTQDGERNVELKRVGDVQSVSVAYHMTSGSHPDYATFDFLNEILTNQPNGRLYQSLVKSGKASTVWAYDPGLKDPSFFYLNADVLKERSLDSAKEILFRTIDELKTKPVTADEVEKARNKLMKNFEETYRNTEYTGLTLSEFMAAGDWRLAFIYRDNLKKVTADDVNRVIKKYFVKSNRTVGVFIPTESPKRADIPASPNVDSMVRDYKGQEALAQAEAFDPSPDNIETRTERGTIPGGAQYALLPKTTRGGTVQANFVLRMGDEKSLNGKATLASVTADMLKRGTKEKTMAQINEALDKLSSSVNIFGGQQYVYVMLQSTRENLPAALDVVAEILRKPSFPEAEFKTMITERITGMEQERSEPQSIASREFNKVENPFPKGDYHYINTLDEDIAATKTVTIDDVRNFYKTFYNGSNATVGFVGDFDPGVVKERLNVMLANWTAPVAYKRVPDVFADVKPENREIKTPDKKNAMMMAGMNLKIRDDNPDYPALVMGDFIFGGGFLNSRLATRIRQKEGISYGVGSWLQADSRDETGSFGSYAIYNPDNKTKLEAAWLDEMNKMLKDGFTEDELKQAKSAIIQYRQSSRTEDMSLANKLSSYLNLGRTMAWDKSFDEKLQNVTLAQLNEAMKKYLDAGKISFVKAGDFK
ncbi:M16 family metallopeptidase [Chitinophagaceae bacterium MMS25-I14]